MTPYLMAAQWCTRNGEDFLSKLLEHIHYGWVYSGDDAFVLATEENKEGLLAQDENNDLDKDTWFIYLYAGNLKRGLELIPHRRKYIAFRRDNGRIRVYDMEKLLKKLEIL